MRIAWVGPPPAPGGGGVAGAAWLIVEGLSAAGHHIDLYLDCAPTDAAEAIRNLPEVNVFGERPRWEWDRWYSKNHVAAFATGLAARAAARRQLGSALIEAHRRRPYDVLYQFSTIEVFGYRQRLSTLPPLVIHPEVHMAGELRSWRQERSLVARCEPGYRRVMVPTVLAGRAFRQARDIKLAKRVIGISSVFGDLLTADYGVQPDRLRIVPNPIDLASFRAKDRTQHKSPDRLVLLFVGRISTRKGIEKLVSLSHRLDDLKGQVELRMVGGHTLWSDYRPLLSDLNPRIASYTGPLSSEDVQTEMRAADLFLIPSTYEPFGLTAAEALASGVPVVSSDQVGATERVSSSCCWRFSPEDDDGLHLAVRKAIKALRSPRAHIAITTARSEAERLFAPSTIAAGIASVLAEATDRPAK